MDAPANRLELNRVWMDYAPLWFQHTQFILIYCSAIFWSLAYVFYMRQAFRDQSYGMPIVSLCANIAWEAVYGLMRSPGPDSTMISTTWMVLDLGLVYTTIKFGPREWQQAPLVARNLSAIVLIGCLVMLAMNWCFSRLFDDDRFTPCFWSAFGLQVIVSWAAIAQLISRGHTRGHSMMIWFLRFIGTLVSIVAWLFRVCYYPVVFDYAGTHLAFCIYGLATIGDLLYPAIFLMVKSGEKTKTW